MNNLMKCTESQAVKTDSPNTVRAVTPAPVKILVVDDNHSNLTVTSLWLDQLGYSHEKIDNAAEAIAMYKTGAFKIILMDVRMCNMNGHEATRLIRQYEELNKLKPSFIIALTADALLGEREKCLLSGMDQYISKPVDFMKLDSMLSEYCRAQPAN